MNYITSLSLGLVPPFAKKGREEKKEKRKKKDDYIQYAWLQNYVKGDAQF